MNGPLYVSAQDGRLYVSLEGRYREDNDRHKVFSCLFSRGDGNACGVVFAAPNELLKDLLNFGVTDERPAPLALLLWALRGDSSAPRTLLNELAKRANRYGVRVEWLSRGEVFYRTHCANAADLSVVEAAA